MKIYQDLLLDILRNGVQKNDRTGTGTLSVFGRQLRFDLGQGFPLLTTKKMFAKGIIHELLWFLRGDTNIKYLNDNGVHIWDEWADAHGDLGPVYGAQWLRWEGPDRTTYNQIVTVLEQIRRRPDSRRLIVSAWNVPFLDRMKLPPCHCLFQFYVANQKLSCQMYQRSADVFLGVPFNLASYALLTLMVAQVSGLQPGEFIHTFGDVHIYLNHLEAVSEQLARQPRPLPQMRLNSLIADIFAFRFEDFELLNYHPHPAIVAPVAV